MGKRIVYKERNKESRENKEKGLMKCKQFAQIVVYTLFSIIIADIVTFVMFVINDLQQRNHAPEKKN